jgi:hypothetical protein
MSTSDHIISFQRDENMKVDKSLYSFQCSDEECIENEFDVITCLSTVKWMHLNNGDSGVQRLFRKGTSKMF